MKITFLGTGTSHGLPYVGCDCPVCTSTDPHNKRLRCSVLVEDTAGTNRILIDTSPDLRQQLLRANIDWLSAIIWTHPHNDHIIGLDDIRQITNNCGYIDGYTNAATMEHLHRVFGYAFEQGREYPGFPRLTPHITQDLHSFKIGIFEITPIPIMHGQWSCSAYRIRDGKSTFTYTTDCSFIPDNSWRHLSNADVLVVDALRPEPHPTHFSIEQALEAIKKLQPGRAFLTHFAHEVDHATVSAQLPIDVELAYDMLTLFL